MKNCILGNGQVAGVLLDIIPSSIAFDKREWEGLYSTGDNCDCLHISIPYSDEFIKIVQQAKLIFNPDITIIHSTVKPGTSKQLSALYSPIIGRHGDGFTDSVLEYTKFIAGNRDEYLRILDEFPDCELRNWGPNTDELEYAKIMSTTRMYWDLVFQKEMQNDCKKYNYDFDMVYSRWTRNYNDGIKLEHNNWRRPIYDKMETDRPGGHCLRPNIHLVDNVITKTIKDWENAD